MSALEIPTYALSVRQPWAWAILHANKRVENRDWAPDPDYWTGPGLMLALHACKAGHLRPGKPIHYADQLDVLDDVKGMVASWHNAEAAGGPPAARSPLTPQMLLEHCGCIVGVMRIECVIDTWAELAKEQRPWFCGRFGWVIGEVLALPRPIPCRGLQKLWALGPAEREEIGRQLVEAA